MEKRKKIVVDLVRYERTKIEEILLSKGVPFKARTVYDDVEETFNQALKMYWPEDIVIRTSLLPPQIYKSGMNEIEIIN